MRLTSTQIQALRAVLVSGLGEFPRGDIGFATGGGGRFRSATGLALERAGMVERSPLNQRVVHPTIVAHTLIAMVDHAQA